MTLMIFIGSKSRSEGSVSDRSGKSTEGTSETKDGYEDNSLTPQILIFILPKGKRMKMMLTLMD